MKNVLVFIHPKKKFGRVDYHKEVGTLVRVQIDNSLALGWRPEDILIVTNFPYEYNGIKTVVVPDETYNPKRRTVSKINAIVELYNMGLVTDDLYFFHDLDAFQNEPIPYLPLGDCDLALTHTSVGDKRFSTGVMFFTDRSRYLFEALRNKCAELNTNEEVALRALLRENKKLHEKLLVLNIGYNFAIRKRNVLAQYREADKPIKVLHFHPTDKRPCSHEPERSSLEVVLGLNSFGQSLMSETLMGAFFRHGLL